MIKQNMISVIVPVYNPGKYFSHCIASICHQTYKFIEGLFIDDGSFDESSQLCDEIAQIDARMIVIHKRNKGVSSARNCGIKVMSGEFAYFPDSDDYIEEDTFEYLLKRHEESQCDVINFEHYITYSNREIRHEFKDSFYGIVEKEEALRRMANGVQFCCNKLILSRLITNDSLILFDENIHRGEDTLFAAKVVDRTNTIIFDKRPLYHYVQSESSACRGEFRTSQVSAVYLYEAFKPIYGKYKTVWNTFLSYNHHNLISMYFDMWECKKELEEEKKLVIDTIRKYYPTVMNNERLIRGARLKFFVFNLSPTIFCIIHKMILILKAEK